MFQSWQNVDLEMPIVMGTTTVGLWIVFSDTAGQDTVTKLYRCVVEMETKAKFEDGCVVLSTHGSEHQQRPSQLLWIHHKMVSS